MASILAFGKYLPNRVLTNAELAGMVSCEAAWIEQATGIAERRMAAPEEDVVALGVHAGKDCLAASGIEVSAIAMLLVSSGSTTRSFPGPAADIAKLLNLPAATPAIDLPMASAGSLFGLALASRLAASTGPILLIASEKMTDCALLEPLEKNTSILFGDGAGACIVVPGKGRMEIQASVLHSEGAHTNDLALDFAGRLTMNGMNVIRHASQKIPAAIREVLGSLETCRISTFLMHQANQNLIDRVAKALGVETTRFFSNIRNYGNTSSASMLIAAAEWLESTSPEPGELVCFSAFGAGYHWGALLCEIMA